jgi:hypothetical protein
MDLIINQSRRHLFLIIISLAVFIASPVMAQVHPLLLFNDIRDTPGYQHRTISPWSGYEGSIVWNADNSLTRDFTKTLPSYDREIYRGWLAYNLGLAYQITKNPSYAAKGAEALMSIGVGASPYNVDRSTALGGYSLAYDWIQPTLDSTNDTIIRDKLATLADTVYKELNNNGADRDYIAFADYLGQAYPFVGIAGYALSDYTNPNHLALSSTPANWTKVGTDYLFVNDQLHDYGRSLFSFGFDESSGKHLSGAYKAYVIEPFLWWLQVYSHYTGNNIFDVYPATKKAFTSEIWESMPNGFHNNYITSGNTVWIYHTGILNLLDTETRGQALYHIAQVKGSTLLPYSQESSGDPPAALLYCVMGDYSATPRTTPTWTSHLNLSSVYQVFRNSWANDADWLSLITYNHYPYGNRENAHHDQLSLEYYSRGDLLLADAGEDKYVLDMYYGTYEIHHNTIALEDPRSPFPVAPWSNSSARGIYKGDAGGLITPVTINSLIQVPWIEVLEARAPITRVVGFDIVTPFTLSSPVQYNRSILYPNKEYFILIDRLEGTQTWTYRSIFRPTSLSITPTSGTTIGYVQGSLSLGGTSFDWLGLPYKSETATGITTNSLMWTTRNPYGNNVNLELFTSPASEVLVSKQVGRIAGTGEKSEVYSPIVSFRTPAANNTYRVTALLSRYDAEAARTPSVLTVTGQGNAIKVHTSAFDDYAYTGTGTSSFDSFSTDADTLYIRVTNHPVNYTLMGGTSLDYSGKSFVRMASGIGYIAASEGTNNTSLYIKSGSTTATVTLSQIQQAVSEVMRDGAIYSSWTFASGTLTLTPGQGEHLFEISTTPTTPTPTTTPTPMTPTPTPTATSTPTVIPTTPTPTTTSSTPLTISATVIEAVSGDGGPSVISHEENIQKKNVVEPTQEPHVTATPQANITPVLVTPVLTAKAQQMPVTAVTGNQEPSFGFNTRFLSLEYARSIMTSSFTAIKSIVKQWLHALKLRIVWILVQ